MTVVLTPRADTPAPREPPRARRPGSRPRPQRGLRYLMWWLHRVLGLGAGAVLLVAGLTGSALVFREEIDAALNPRLLRVAPAVERASLQVILDRVVRAYPGEAPTRVRMPRRPDGTYEVWLGAAPSRYVYGDPYREGALLGARRPTEFLIGWLFLLHSHLLTGELGETIAGVAGLVLVALSVTGLAVWWPRGGWGRWRAALTVARGAGVARRRYDLHRAVGFYASALLLLAGLTGASLVFHRAFERAAYWLTATRAVGTARPRAVRRPVAANPPLPADVLLAAARRAQPGGVVSYLYLPRGTGEALRVRLRLPGEEHPNGKSFVHVDPTSARVLAVEDGRRAPRGARLYGILYPLHVGTLGGLPTRVLAVATGLSLPLLALTGLLVWWSRGRRREVVRRRSPR